MVLLFSLVPPLLSGSLSTGALRSTAHQMAAELRQARSLAMVKQQDVVWSLDMEQRVFYTQSSNPTRFSEDINDKNNQTDSSDLMENAKVFFKRNGLLLNWKEFEKLDPTQKINTLAMVAPITNEEKQKLLETISLENKVNTLDSIIGFYLHETSFDNQTVQ